MAAGKVMFFVGNGQLGFTSNIQQSIMADSQSHIFQTMFAMFMSASKTWTIIGQKDQHIPKSLENEPCIFSLFTQARLSLKVVNLVKIQEPRSSRASQIRARSGGLESSCGDFSYIRKKKTGFTLQTVVLYI